jgi:cytochrome b subunit of formate dehydrogenase
MGIMRTSQLAAWLVAATVYVAGTLSSGLVVAAGSKDAAPVAQKLDNATCQTCHDGKKGKLEVPKADGEKRELHAVNTDKYGKSVHARMECVACHKEITDSVTPHQKVAGAPKVDCAQCHLDLWEAAKKDGKTAEKPRLGIVAENVEAYKKSFHAKQNKDDPTKLNAICSDCHNVHTFGVPLRGTQERKDWHLTVPDICGKCHEDHLEDWTTSIHGKEAKEKKNLKTAVCSDCHTTHDIIGSSSDKAKLSITASCGDCHKDAYESYKASYHGQVNRLGYAYTAKCADCHGSHAIEASKDPKSKMHEKNRLKTCQKCHSGKEGKPALATAGFISFSPHGNSHDFAKYPEIWLTTKAMIALLIGVFTFFWLHSGLWWYREYADRKAGKNVPHVMTDKLPPEFATKHVRRFGPMWRIAHLLFALSVMVLVLTGMAAFFPETSWAKTVMAAFGTPKIAGQVHRWAAYTMLGIFAIHLVVITIGIARNWKNFKFFGPDSFVPNWKDLDDIIGMFKWFVGDGPRPRIERWSYWEKFDYWAVFWGMAIIGGSGMMLAFPHVVAAYLPGWVFNVAMVVHGEEAVLAAVFLFTVHFFNNHFRPDKLPPPDVVMFTGSQSLQEFRHEHRAQYDRLVETGELEKYLVDAPSAPFTLASKILGLVLLAFGLSLLAMIAIGFLSGGGH